MLPRHTRFGSPASPSSPNAPSYPFGLRSPLPARWSGRERRAVDTPLSVSSSPPVSTVAPITVSDFIEKYTRPAASRLSKGECPICLEAYATEDCLQITGISGCSHFIGGSCLKDMLKYQPLEDKKCPLCRTVWISGASPASTLSRIRGRIAARTANALLAVRDGISDTAGGPVQAENVISSDDQSVPQHAQVSRLSSHGDTQRRNIRRPEHRHPEYSSRIQGVPSTGSVSDIRINEDELEYSSAEALRLRIRAMEDVADMHRRAEIMRYQRRLFRRRQLQLRDIYPRDHLCPNSDDIPTGEPAISRTISSGTYTAMTNATNRSYLINARAQSPFRPGTPETAPSVAAMTDSVNSIDTRGVARAQRQHSARVSELHGTAGHGTPETSSRQINTSSSSVNFSRIPLRVQSPGSSDETNVTRSDNQLPSTIHWADPVGARERQLELWTESLDARHANLRRRETIVTERTNRVECILEHVNRQQEELEELVRRHREELASILEEYST